MRERRVEDVRDQLSADDHQLILADQPGPPAGSRHLGDKYRHRGRGAAIGSLMAGTMSDKYGRRTTLMGLAMVFLVGVLGTTLAPSVAVMVAMRFVLGLAVGGASATVPVFIAEMAGPSRRARLVSQNELMIVSGQLIAYVLNAVLAHASGSPHVWRYKEAKIK